LENKAGEGQQATKGFVQVGLDGIRHQLL